MPAHGIRRKRIVSLAWLETMSAERAVGLGTSYRRIECAP